MYFNLFKSEFIKSVLVLITGTVFAQLFTILISPVLTRLYTPQQMGDLNVYLRIVNFISVIATARYELSLPIPKLHQHAFLLYKFSYRIARNVFGICLGSLLIYSVFFLPNESLFYLLVFTFLTSVFLVVSNLGTSWSIRNKQFKKISYSRMSNALVNNVLKWIFGVFGFGTIGLYLASFLGYLLSSFPFLISWMELKKNSLNLESKSKTWLLAKEYKEFPLVNLPHVLVDYGKDLLIAFFMIFYFSKDVFGWYSHSYTILQLPIAVVGASIGQVFFNKCAELIHNGQSTLDLLRQTVKTLVLIAVFPFTILFFFGEDLFSFVFGAKWGEAGLYSEVMSSWFFMSFMTSVTSTLPTILKRQKQFFVLGIISALVQLIGFGILPMFIGRTNQDFISILKIVSFTQTLFFIYILWRMFVYSKSGVKS